MRRSYEDCKPFVEETERLFGASLHRYALRLTDCFSAHEGRECHALYEGEMGSLLFLLQDGSADCMVGAVGTAAPPLVLVHGTGDYGWYHVRFLAEVEADQRLVSRRLMQAFITGRTSYFAWQATLLNDRADRLFSLLATQDAVSLTTAVQHHVRQLPRW